MAASLLLATATASANERTQLVDQIMRTGSLACANEAHEVARQNMLSRMTLGFADRLRKSAQLDARWAPGNRDYEKYRSLIAAAVIASERSSGPLFAALSGTSAIRAGFEPMPITELRAAAAFFKRRAGRVYWKYMFEFGNCIAIVTRLADFPGAGPQPALMARLAALKESADEELRALPEADAQEYSANLETLRERMLEALVSSLNFPIEPLFKRAFEIVEENAAELDLLALPYKLEK